MLVPLANARRTTSNSSARFEAQLAMSQLTSASKPADFEAAATAFQRLVDSGIRNAPLFYNYGITLLMADHPAQALQAFIRSERYSGTTWDLRRNMLVATAKMQNSPDQPRLPWYRIPLFWHYGISASTRLTLTAIAFSLLCLLPIMHTTRFKGIYRLIFTFSVIAFVIFGSSSATTIYQELHPHNLLTAQQEPPQINKADSSSN
jgi:hypothetical protein